MNSQLAGTHLWNLRRGWAGANLCRDRLMATAENAPRLIDGASIPVKDLRDQHGHDVDYYSWEAVRILNIAAKVVTAGLRGMSQVQQAIEGWSRSSARRQRSDHCSKR